MLSNYSIILRRFQRTKTTLTQSVYWRHHHDYVKHEIHKNDPVMPVHVPENMSNRPFCNTTPNSDVSVTTSISGLLIYQSSHQGLGSPVNKRSSGHTHSAAASGTVLPQGQGVGGWASTSTWYIKKTGRANAKPLNHHVSGSLMLDNFLSGYTKSSVFVPMALKQTTSTILCPHIKGVGSNGIGLPHLSTFRNTRFPVLIPAAGIHTQNNVQNDDSDWQYQRLLKKLRLLENQLRFHGYSMIRVGLVAALIAGFGVFIFREHIREKAADEVSNVASRSLSDENVKIRAHELSKELLNAILEDVHLQSQAVTFVEKLLAQQETKQAVVNLLSSVIKDPQSQQDLVLILKHVLNVALSDENFRRELAQNLSILFQYDNVRQSLLDLLHYLLKNEDFIMYVRTFILSVLESEELVERLSVLGKNALEDIVHDTKIQKDTGDALWTAFTYSLTPRFFSRNNTGVNEDIGKKADGG